MNKKILSVIFLFNAIIALGQTDTISTNLANTNSGSAVSFEVTATSALDIVGLSNLWHTSASSTEIWIRTGGVGGAGGGSLTVNAANGWTMHQTISVIGKSTHEVWVSNLVPISIPAGNTIGIVITGNMHYNGSGTTPITPNSFPGTFAAINAGGPFNGFGGSGAPPVAMTFTPRGFIGSIAVTKSSCASPTNFVAPASSIGCNNIDLTWTADTGSIASNLIWDVAGFDPALGGNIISNAQSPESITGLVPGTAYDFYLIDSCSFGLTAPLLLTDTTLALPTSSFAQMQTSVNSNGAVINFDASSSTNYSNVQWDFGDGTANGTNAIENHTYTQNQTYSVTLTLTNACGSVDSTFTLNITGIGIEETEWSTPFSIYPNPTKGAVNLEFHLALSNDVCIKVVDAFGHLLVNKEMGQLYGKQNIELDLEGNANGIYFVLIVSEMGTISRRVSLEDY